MVDETYDVDSLEAGLLCVVELETVLNFGIMYIILHFPTSWPFP